MNKMVDSLCFITKKFYFYGIDVDWESGLKFGKHSELIENLRNRLDDRTAFNRKMHLSTAMHIFHKNIPDNVFDSWKTISIY